MTPDKWHSVNIVPECETGKAGRFPHSPGDYWDYWCHLILEHANAFIWCFVRIFLSKCKKWWMDLHLQSRELRPDRIYYPNLCLPLFASNNEPRKVARFCVRNNMPILGFHQWEFVTACNPNRHQIRALPTVKLFMFLIQRLHRPASVNTAVAFLIVQLLASFLCQINTRSLPD